MLNRNSSAGTAAQKSSKCSLIQRPAIILAILLLCAVLFGCERKSLFGCERKRLMSKKDIMDVYTAGYSWGYDAARQQAKKYRRINDTTLVFDYSNYDTCRVIDSLRVVRDAFK